MQTRNRCSVVCIVAKLWAGNPGFYSRQGTLGFRHLQNVHTGPRAHTASYSMTIVVDFGALINTSIKRRD
jgi:hypothetical protein